MGCHVVMTGISEKKKKGKKKRRKRCFKLKENLEKFRAHTASVTYLESFTLALDAWQTTYSSRKSSYSQFCNYLALQNTWHLYSSILYCIKTESQFSLQLTSCHQKQSVWYKAREKPAPPQIRNKSSTQGDTQIKKIKKNHYCRRKNQAKIFCFPSTVCYNLLIQFLYTIKSVHF